MKKLLFICFGFFLLVSCTTRVTPKKVDRIIVKDSWKITSFMFNGEQISDQFGDKKIGFGEDGDVQFIPTAGETGSWNTGTEKKPTLLYIQGFVSEPYFNLNDDWSVIECSSSSIKLESQVGSVTNSITLIKVSN